MKTNLIAIAVALLTAFGCSSSTDETDETDPEEVGCTVDADCLGLADTPLCGLDSGACEPLPQGHPIGWRDGTATSVSFVAVYQPSTPIQATDLAFHPDRINELWVLRREPALDAVCSQTDTSGCFNLPGTMAVVTNPGTDQAIVAEFLDPNALHFMRLPPAFAFGDNGNFATVGEARTGNFTDEPIDFIGPVLWSSALPGVSAGCQSAPQGCFSVQPPGLNGSHLDMLHASPYGMGIAHETANAYWVFNGQIGSLDRYDFHQDHGPGNEDHSDGEISRYMVGLTRSVGVPSHMVYDAASTTLYVADTGAGRIVSFDTTSGTPGGPVTPNYDGVVNNRMMDGVALNVVVPPGLLVAPSGLELHDGLLYVTDNATGSIYAFDLEGTLVRSLVTGLPAGHIGGFTIGPDGKAYFTNLVNGLAVRIDPL